MEFTYFPFMTLRDFHLELDIGETIFKTPLNSTVSDATREKKHEKFTVDAPL